MCKKILVSSCLLGINSRYDGRNSLNEKVLSLKNTFELIPVCPEQMGGLTTPRCPSEIIKDRVINKDGIDVTKNYLDGSKAALSIALENDCKYAILKLKSPACGKDIIYDGSFTNKLTQGNGTLVSMLLENNIEVYSENEIDELINTLINQC